jgi:hypothetical protein
MLGKSDEAQGWFWKIKILEKMKDTERWKVEWWDGSPGDRMKGKEALHPSRNRVVGG